MCLCACFADHRLFHISHVLCVLLIESWPLFANRCRALSFHWLTSESHIFAFGTILDILQHTHKIGKYFLYCYGLRINQHNISFYRVSYCARLSLSIRSKWMRPFHSWTIQSDQHKQMNVSVGLQWSQRLCVRCAISIAFFFWCHVNDVNGKKCDFYVKAYDSLNGRQNSFVRFPSAFCWFCIQFFSRITTQSA